MTASPRVLRARFPLFTSSPASRCYFASWCSGFFLLFQMNDAFPWGDRVRGFQLAQDVDGARCSRGGARFASSDGNYVGFPEQRQRRPT
jgi:hypothetical protein